MLTLQKTRATDKWQDYKIQLQDGIIHFSTQHDDIKAKKVLTWLQDENITHIQNMTFQQKTKCIKNSIEYLTNYDLGIRV